MSRLTLLAAVAASALAASSASAADFSFTGTFPDPATVQFFDFTVGAASNVTLRTWSYAGGVNAAGNTIARGGFDPILAVFSLADGSQIGQNDDGGCGLVAADSVSGQCWDTFFTAALNPGNYRVSVQVYPNFAPGNLSGTFAGATTFADVSGAANNPRDNHWAFDILNVGSAVVIPGVPEPTSWAMLIAGFGIVGAVARRRRVLANVAA